MDTSGDLKKIILKDLASRLPYGVIVQYKSREKKNNVVLSYGNISYVSQLGDVWWSECKPYLRSMSSMTEEEQKEFAKFHCVNICPIVITEELTISNEAKMFDWLNKNMFDYRGLIPAGVAIEVTEDNNPYKD